MNQNHHSQQNFKSILSHTFKRLGLNSGIKAKAYSYGEGMKLIKWSLQIFCPSVWELTFSPLFTAAAPTLLHKKYKKASSFPHHDYWQQFLLKKPTSKIIRRKASLPPPPFTMFLALLLENLERKTAYWPNWKELTVLPLGCIRCWRTQTYLYQNKEKIINKLCINTLYTRVCSLHSPSTSITDNLFTHNMQ